jgi:hypothetical protein
MVNPYPVELRAGGEALIGLDHPLRAIAVQI